MGRGALNMDGDAPANTVAITDADANATGRALDTIDSAARATLAATSSPDEMAIPIQFVLNVDNAQSVSLVGEFNGWDATAEPLERVNNSSLWTTTRSLKPGRHVYAYVVNGTRWIRDPRAPEAQDEDFGRPQSVIVVQSPWTGIR
jgi:1,4-alpha-glucan branching enzyme